MATKPTGSDVNYAYAFSEHWPGGSHTADHTTSYNGNNAIVYNSFSIGSSYSATVTYKQGAHFVGYAVES